MPSFGELHLLIARMSEYLPSEVTSMLRDVLYTWF